jgi:hypothetical protein
LLQPGFGIHILNICPKVRERIEIDDAILAKQLPLRALEGGDEHIAPAAGVPIAQAVHPAQKLLVVARRKVNRAPGRVGVVGKMNALLPARGRSSTANIVRRNLWRRVNPSAVWPVDAQAACQFNVGFVGGE